MTVKRSLERVRFMQREGVSLLRFFESPDDAREQARWFLAGVQLRGKKGAFAGYVKSLNWLAQYASRPGADARYEHVRWRSPTPPRSQAKVFTVHQVEQLLAYRCPGSERQARRRALVWVSLNTGLRRSEIAGLRVQDLDEERGGMYVAAPAKEGKRRWIPIHPDAWSPKRPLQCWLRLRPVPVPDAGALWTSRARGCVHALDSDTLARDFSAIGEDVGFLVSYTRFRHYRGRALTRAGCHPRVLQELYGHANPSSTAVYNVPDCDSMQEELRRIGAGSFRGKWGNAHKHALRIGVSQH